jgi:hypothetical protein
MTFSLSDRIKSQLAKLDKNPSSVALEAGLGRSAVRDIIVGKVDHPRIDTLKKLTGPLKCSLDYLTGDTEDPGEPIPSNAVSSRGRFDSQEVHFFRWLEVGVFRSEHSSEGSMHRWEGNTDDRDLEPNERYLVYNDFRFPDWEVDLYRVKDRSLLELDIKPGDFLTVVSPRTEEIIPLKPGSLVVVSHTVGIQGLTEISARMVELHSDGIALVGRARAPDLSPPPIIIRESSDPENDEFFERILPNMYLTTEGSLAVRGVVSRLTRDMPIG